MMLRNLALATALSLGAATAWAGGYQAGSIQVDDLWVRATAPGQPNGAGYLDLHNAGLAGDRLVAVRTEAAERAEVHTVATENGVARMRGVDGGVELPAGGEVKFAPGGYHIMFMKLKAPFAESATVPATLVFEKAGEVPVAFTVKPISYNPGAGGHGMDMSGHGMTGHSMK